MAAPANVSDKKCRLSAIRDPAIVLAKIIGAKTNAILIATPRWSNTCNLPAENRLTTVMAVNAVELWPLGNVRNPSLRSLLSEDVQSATVPMPYSKDGWHRSKKSGRGSPNVFFNKHTMRIWVAILPHKAVSPAKVSHNILNFVTLRASKHEMKKKTRGGQIIVINTNCHKGKASLGVYEYCNRKSWTLYSWNGSVRRPKVMEMVAKKRYKSQSNPHDTAVYNEIGTFPNGRSA